jgi:hypothetical protein
MDAPSLIVAVGALLASHQVSSQTESNMNVQVTINGTPVTVTLQDNAAARDLLQQLPLSMEFKDYASAEKVAYPPRKLSTAGAPPGMTPSAGDIAYYAPWGNLALFYRDQPYASGLVKLGSLGPGVEALKKAGALRISFQSAN